MSRLTQKRWLSFFKSGKAKMCLDITGYTQIRDSKTDPRGERFYLIGEAVEKLAAYEDAEEKALICSKGIEKKTGRLISADSYLKNFCNRFCDVKECTRTQKKSCCIAISLQEEPTAFDADKIIKQLENLKKYAETRDCPKDGMCDGGDCENCHMNTAIEIVKAGGKQ